MTVLTIRCSKRYALRQTAAVRSCSGQKVRGLLIELSQEGGRISGLDDVDFASGDQVVLEVDELALPGVVRWTSPGVLGLRFEQALYAAELNAMLTQSRSEITASAQAAA